MASAFPVASDTDVLHFLVPRASPKGRQGFLHIHGLVCRGLPYSAFESLTRFLHLGSDELNDAIGIPRRTAARRKGGKGFTADESDKVFRVGRVFVEARAVLGDDERAARWIKRPNGALGGKRPMDLFLTDVGVRQVCEVLGRTRHGIYS